MTSGEIIKMLRDKQGMSQEDLASRIGVSRTMIAKYESGESSPSQKVVPLARLFGVTTDYILGNSENPHPPVKGNRIPVLGRVAAGVPFEAIQNIEDYEEIPDSWGDPREYFALKIQGHSMEPRIWDGDIIIVKKQNDVDSGQIAVVLVDGEDATVKQIKKSDSGITLIGFNPAVYSPHFYTAEEVEKLPVSIIGLVKEVRGTL